MSLSKVEPRTGDAEKSVRILTAGFLCLLLLGVGACTAENAAPPAQVYTQQAMTLQAVLTDAALPPGAATAEPVNATAATGDAQPNPTESSHAVQTETPLPTNTNTPLPTSTTITIPCLRADFVKDVTIPDNTKLTAGTTFKKTWRVRNSGSCAWTSNFQLALYANERMAGKDDVLDVNVGVGEEVDLSVWLTAPLTAGAHRGDWKLRNPQGTWFGVGPTGSDSLTVLIISVVLTPTVTSTPTIAVTPTETPTITPMPTATSIPPTATPTTPGYPPAG
jgi:hypothetical protein